MSAERLRRVEQILAEARRLHPSERNQFLRGACGGDDLLRQAVESMLALVREPQGEIETHVITAEPTLIVSEAPDTRASRDDFGRFTPGEIIAGRYRATSLLGRGGMGEVYRADDLKLGQTVALKFLSESLARNGAALARFHREVSLARQVSHRHVCRVYDIGEHGGLHFLTMEYIRGEELASLLKRVGRLPGEKAVEMARQLCAGLGAIHATGVIHRDLKPANVMIDEHGDVRITDFGVAALSEGISGREAMVGTPAYMAPEQLIGGEVTPRSDIYALGLILYEALTGSRAFSGASLDEVVRTRLSQTTPTQPSSLVGDVDPNVERVILRCLEHDPSRRPASALEVAAALPGGDPLAAALAAGETPSPQMVAAAPAEGSLRPAHALLLLAWIAGAIVALSFVSRVTSLHRLEELERPPELLRATAAEIAQRAGYVAGGDELSGFDLDLAAVAYLSNHARSMRALLQGCVAPIHFWVRWSPRPIESNGEIATWSDPPNDDPGAVRVRLSPSGKLLQFDAVPPVDGSGTNEWTALFNAAGIVASTLRADSPAGTLPRFADMRVAWTGVDRAGTPLRVEAGSARGMPVHFEVIAPAEATALGSEVGGEKFFLVLVALNFGAMAFGALLAWKNFRAGRGDRRGTFRLMIVIFVARLAYWFVVLHHVPTGREVTLAIDALQSAVYWSALVGLLYLALEPFIRRRWPTWLISWSRLLSGDIRDPLVGRDVLAGAGIGVAGLLALQLFNLFAPRIGVAGHGIAVNSLLLYTFGLAGARGFVPLLVNQISASVVFPLILMSIVLFFAMLTRNTSRGIAITWILVYLVLGLNFGDRSALAYLLGLILPTLLLFALAKFGLLALVTMFYFLHLTSFYPVTTDLGAWYATSWILQLAVVAVVVAIAARAAIGGQKLVSEAFLE